MTRPTSRYGIIVGNVLATLAFAAGVWSIVWNFLPDAQSPALDAVFAATGLYTGPSLFLGLLMMVLAGGLLRRLRAALVVCLLMQATSLIDLVAILAVVTHRLPRSAAVAARHSEVAHFHAVTLACAAVAVVLTALAWPAFRVRLAPGSWWRSAVALAAGLAASALVTFGLSWIAPGDLASAVERLAWSFVTAVGMPDAPLRVLHRHSGPLWISTVADVISAVALIAALWVLLRSVRSRGGLSASDELDVRRLLLQHGEADSLGYFATRRDKEIVFSPDRQAAINYRVEVSACVASADPIGDPRSWPHAIAAWLDTCAAHGWYPAALSASTAGAKAYVAAGLKALTMGDEAILTADSFSLAGSTMGPVRRAVRRMERAGCTVSVRRQHDIDDDELRRLSGLAARWRGNDTERGFSMALDRLGDRSDDRVVVVVARTAAGDEKGLLTLVPWGRGGLSLDVMRRAGDADNGVTEFMVAGLMKAADGLGVRRVSLNFAMFRNVFSSAEDVGAGPLTRLGDKALGFASRFWQLESLYRSNAKYQPDWLPRYLCYDSSVTLGRAAFACAIAEGFVPQPGDRRRDAGPDGEPLDGRRKGRFHGFAHHDGAPPHEAIRRRPEGFPEQVRALEKELLGAALPPRGLTEQERWRRVKLQRLVDAGFEGYPARVPRDTSIGELRLAYPALAADQRTGDVRSVAGRVRAIRDFGGVTFLVLQEEGQVVQVIVAGEHTPATAHQLLRRVVDLGDHLSVTGEVVTSRRGELSIAATSWTMAAKALRPVPGLGTRFADPEARTRNRSLDLIVNTEALTALRARSAAVAALRDGFARRGFLEVETPMLQAVHGGATARPFRTWINAYAMRLYLRIAPELYLKKLAVGGMPRIFELNRNFRNEGADATHNPEFTSVEAYQAYADYQDMRVLTRELIIEAAVAVHGEPVCWRPDADGTLQRVPLDGPWPVVTVHDAVSRVVGVQLTAASPVAEVAAVCQRHGIPVDAAASAGELVLELYEALVEKQTQAPTFYIDFPVETCPLTRPHRGDPRLAERWDLVAFGAELGTAYSELVDPLDQRARLTAQSLAAARGDAEAMVMDESFLQALELGMPPTGGLGLGVDRIVMMLLGSNIRGTLAFPFVRPT